jgi:DUF1680 family protein
LEGNDIEGKADIDDIQIPADVNFKTVKQTIDGHTFTALEGKVELAQSKAWNNRQLYRELKNNNKQITVRLIPYYAWGNRGNQDMTVWMNVRK